MRKVLILFMLLTALTIDAQRMLSLDECRAMALSNNKQLRMARVKQEVALNTRKAVRTKYLPKVDVLGGYEYFSREISLLSKEQKAAFSNLGTTAMTGVSGNMSSVLTGLVQQGLISPEMAQQMGIIMNQMGQPAAQIGNQLGQKINDAFKTDTRNIFAASVTLRQPVYMGGAITAANRMADINEELVAHEQEGMTQATLKNIDDIYWTVISLKQKQQLAISYRNLVQKLDDDVHKMINEGVATRATGLQVDVKVNEADMQLTQVDNGLVLAKMLLCQLCGLPLDSEITLADEGKDVLPYSADAEDIGNEAALENRSELKMLENTIELSKQTTKLVRAAYLPQVALTGGYLLSNPNL